jgi:TetR/AcrR family transcriptional regulator, mexJK operon transcriptional repressor
VKREEPERRRQILEAASRVFSQKGFGGASMRAIAREAGIKQPLIYWYFEGKEDLFRAVLSELSPLFERMENPEDLMDRPPEEVLSLIASMELGSYDDPKLVRLFRIVIAESALNPEGSGRYLEESQSAVLGFLAAYLRRQIELGRLKAHDAESAARSFFGAQIFYFLAREVFPHMKEGLPDQERYIENVVGVFLDGLQSTNSTKEPRQ